MFLSYFWFRSLWLKKNYTQTLHTYFFSSALMLLLLLILFFLRCLLLAFCCCPQTFTFTYKHQSFVDSGPYLSTRTHTRTLNTQTNHSFVRRLSLENKNTSTPILITLNSPTLADGHAWCSLHSLRYVCQTFSFIFNFETKPMKVLNLAFIRRYLFQPIP